jgi:hypothetical protein
MLNFIVEKVKTSKFLKKIVSKPKIYGYIKNYFLLTNLLFLIIIHNLDRGSAQRY